MHAFSRIVQEKMDDRGMLASDLATASGLSKATISTILKDQRDRLDAMPDRGTVSGLARALGISNDRLMLAAAEAYGVPVDAPITVATAEGMPDSELARELLRRATAREGETPTIAPMDMSGSDAGGVLQIVELRRELITRAAGEQLESPSLARALRYLAEVLAVSIEAADRDAE